MKGDRQINKRRQANHIIALDFSWEDATSLPWLHKELRCLAQALDAASTFFFNCHSHSTSQSHLKKEIRILVELNERHLQSQQRHPVSSFPPLSTATAPFPSNRYCGIPDISETCLKNAVDTLPNTVNLHCLNTKYLNLFSNYDTNSFLSQSFLDV